MQGTALAILGTIFATWAIDGFGALKHEYATALGLTLLGLGIQVVFGSFFLALLTMRLVSAGERKSGAPNEPEHAVAAER